MLKGLTLNGFYRLGLVKQVQRGTITIASGAASGTAPINTVVMENTLLHFLGLSNEMDGSDDVNAPYLRMYLDTPTQVKAESYAGESITGHSVTISFEAIEMFDGVLRVQRGTVSGGAGNTDLPINAVVMDNTFLNWLGHDVQIGNGAGGHSSAPSPLYYHSFLKLLNSATIRQTQSAGGVWSHRTNWELVEILLEGLD